MQKILVTGAAGRVGKAVTTELEEAGYQVVGTDRPADLSQPGLARQLLDGCDAVIHLAAYPTPLHGPGHEVFANNCLSTFHVLQAAVELGISNAVIASSISAYGMAWATHPFSPLYLPLDEDHPMRPHEAYGLSKQVDEQTAAMFHRGHGLTVVAMRFHWVATAEEIRHRMAEFAADPDDPRSAAELWGYIEIRDAARACRLALSAPPGFHPVHIVSPRTLSDIPTADLIARFHPDTPVREKIPGTASPYTGDRARELFGFAPEWTPDEEQNQ